MHCDLNITFNEHVHYDAYYSVSSVQRNSLKIITTCYKLRGMPCSCAEINCITLFLNSGGLNNNNSNFVDILHFVPI